MGVFNELQKIWSRIRGIEQRLEGYDEVVIVSALPTNPIDGVMYQFNGNFYYHLNGTWHVAVTVPSDVNQLTDTNGLFTGVPTTAEDLETLMDASELVPGRNYIITDFAQAYNIFDGGTMEIFEEQIGTAEVLFVTAVSESKLHHVAISAMYPQDEIHFSLKLLDDRDIGFGDGAGTPCEHFKGMIYYRKDTVQNVETHFDFRNIKFRRWAVDAELYEDGQYATYTGQVSGMTTDITLTADVIGVGGNIISLLGDGIKTVAVLVLDWNTANPANTVTVTAGDDTQIPDNGFYMTLDDGVDPIAYVAKDVCKSGVDGKIYKCITATTGEGDPTVNTADWVLWLDITADAFVSWTADKTYFNVGDITTTNLIINNVTAGDDYDDFSVIDDFSLVTHFNQLPTQIDVAILQGYPPTILNNQIIKKDGYLIIGNITLYGVCSTLTSTSLYNSNIGSTYSINNGEIGYANTYSKNSITKKIKESNLFFITDSIIGNQDNVNCDEYNKVNLQKCYDCNFGKLTSIIAVQDLRYIQSSIQLSTIDLSTATIIYDDSSKTIYKDKTDGVKLSYMDGGVMIIADVTD